MELTGGLYLSQIPMLPAALSADRRQAISHWLVVFLAASTPLFRSRVPSSTLGDRGFSLLHTRCLQQPYRQLMTESPPSSKPLDTVTRHQVRVFGLSYEIHRHWHVLPTGSDILLSGTSSLRY